MAKGLGPSLLALNIGERVHEPRSIGTALTNRQQTGDLNPTAARTEFCQQPESLKEGPEPQKSL